MKSALLLSIGLLVVSWVFAFEAPPGRTGDVPLLPGPDSTRRSTRWEERVRRSEIEVIRQARPERESLVSCSWTPAELAERVRDRDTKAMRGDERGFVLRVNTLRWLTLTPEAGVEWRLNYRWGVLASAAWSSWSWDDGGCRYALWNVSPEVRYYLPGGWYAGVFLHGGEFNYKLGATGRQGDYLGGGIAVGYRVPLGRRLFLSLDVGVEYMRGKYDKYRLVDGRRMRAGKVEKNYTGVNRLGVNLEFRIR